MRERALAGRHEPESAAYSLLERERERGILSSSRCKSGCSEVPRLCIAVKSPVEAIFDCRSLIAHVPSNDVGENKRSSSLLSGSPTCCITGKEVSNCLFYNKTQNKSINLCLSRPRLSKVFYSWTSCTRAVASHPFSGFIITAPSQFIQPWPDIAGCWRLDRQVIASVSRCPACFWWPHSAAQGGKRNEWLRGIALTPRRVLSRPTRESVRMS